MRTIIKGLNAVRAIAIALVILSHLGITAYFHSSGLPILPNIFTVFDANFGVRLFFALSGFLITTLLIVEYKAQGRIDVPAFMVRRALRILPLYFAAITLVFILYLLFPGYVKWSYTAVGYASFFIYNYLPPDRNLNYLSHLWSLAVEEQFYLFWPFAFLLLYPLRMLVPFSLVIIGLCLYVIQAWPGLAAWTIPAIYPIILGALFAILAERDAFRRIVGSRPAIVAFILMTFVPMVDQGIWAPHISIFGASGAIVWMSLNQSNRGVEILEFRPLVYVGRISYGLYIWQGIFIGNGPYRERPFPPDIWTGLAITLIVSPIAYHLFEVPLLRLNSRFLKRDFSTQKAPSD